MWWWCTVWTWYGTEILTCSLRKKREAKLNFAQIVFNFRFKRSVGGNCNRSSWMWLLAQEIIKIHFQRPRIATVTRSGSGWDNQTFNLVCLQLDALIHFPTELSGLTCVCWFLSNFTWQGSKSSEKPFVTQRRPTHFFLSSTIKSTVKQWIGFIWNKILLSLEYFGNKDSRSGNNFKSCCKWSACYAIRLQLRNVMYEKVNRGACSFFLAITEMLLSPRSLESRFYYSGFEIARVPIVRKRLLIMQREAIIQ